MKVLIIIVTVAAVLILDIMANGPWQLVRYRQLREYQNEMDRLRRELAKSGTAYYLRDAAVAAEKFADVCRERDIALAENIGLARQVEVLTAINERYITSMSLSSLENVHGLTQRTERDGATGKFIPGNDESESKQIRAYRMDVQGFDKSVIAAKLGISPSSVKTYINGGRRDLAGRDTIGFPDGNTMHFIYADFVDENGELYPSRLLEKYSAAWDSFHTSCFETLVEMEEKNGWKEASN